MTGLTILGSGAGAGKTWHLVGLLRSLRDQGENPVPYKPVSVLDATDRSSSDPRPWARAIYHQLIAAGLPFAPHFNPLVVVRSAADRGELYVSGEQRGVVSLRNEDQIDFDAMTQALYAECREVVVDCLAACRRYSPLVVIEGAGDAGLTGRRPDLANASVPIEAEQAVLAVFRSGASRYSTPSALVDRMPADVRRLLWGVSLNNPDGLTVPATVAEDQHVVGVVGPCELPTHDGTLGAHRARQGALSCHVWQSLPWLDGLAPDRRAAHV
jgi:cobyric acid synthase